MALVPIQYNLRSLIVRRGSTMLTVISIGATIGVLSAVLSLQKGFENVFTERGREDLAVVLRTGAGSEGESSLQRKDVDLLTKGSEEFAVDENGDPIASAESYLAIRRRKFDGGETNVAIRGVQQGTSRCMATSFVSSTVGASSRARTKSSSASVCSVASRRADRRDDEPEPDPVPCGRGCSKGRVRSRPRSGATSTACWLPSTERSSTASSQVEGWRQRGPVSTSVSKPTSASRPRRSTKSPTSRGQTVALTGLFKFLGGFLFS